MKCTKQILILKKIILTIEEKLKEYDSIENKLNIEY